LIQAPEVKELLSQEVIEASKVMKNFERPRMFSLIHEPFTPDNQLLTPKMSLRRKNIMAVYGTLIEALYKGEAGVKVQHE
jgi:long-chain acyl-CoA synthetase